jgi:peptidoglycan/xylan/chitin deacetylase (PgdA/CDA1 family)
VSPVLARYGVHIGWNIDSNDWDCQASSSTPEACITKNVLAEVDEGKSGIVLLHSIHPATAAVLPGLIDALKSRGKRFITVEELVVAKYGIGSLFLVH